MERRKLVIDRRIWLRGEPEVVGGKWEDASQLHRAKDEKMCCVGIYLHACGMSIEALSGHGEAESVLTNDVSNEFYDEEKTFIEEACWLIADRSDPASKLYATNDDSTLPEDVREQIIAKTFAQYGVDVEFVG